LLHAGIGTDYEDNRPKHGKIKGCKLKTATSFLLCTAAGIKIALFLMAFLFCS